MANTQEPEKSLVVSKSDEFRIMEQAARDDPTYISDLNAAVLAPSLLLESGVKMPFEEVFDKVLYHLERAYEKSISSSGDQEKILRACEDLFYLLVVTVQNRIDVKARKSNTELLETIKTKVEGISKTATKTGLAVIAPEGLVLWQFVTYLNDQWELKKDREFFYGQTANVYLKVIKSKCYNPDYGLIRNAFKSKKEGLLHFLVISRNLTSALEMTQYDSDPGELNESARIINKALLIKNDWEGVLDFLRKIKEYHLTCFQDLKREAIDKYRIVLNGGCITNENFDTITHIVKKIAGGVLWFYIASFAVPAFFLFAFLVGFIINLLAAPHMPDGFGAIVKYILGIIVASVSWGVLAGLGSLVIIMLTVLASNVYASIMKSIKLSQWRSRVLSI